MTTGARVGARLRGGLGAVAVAWALAAAGCGGPHSLGGSIGESYSLDYDFIRIRKQAYSLIVEYIRDRGGEAKVLKLVIEGHLLRTPQGDRIPIESGLTIEGELFQKAVRLERVSNQGNREWPEVEHGSVKIGGIEFETEPVGSASGSFDLLFVNGRTLSGSFSGRIEVADLS